MQRMSLSEFVIKIKFSVLLPAALQMRCYNLHLTFKYIFGILGISGINAFYGKSMEYLSSVFSVSYEHKKTLNQIKALYTYIRTLCLRIEKKQKSLNVSAEYNQIACFSSPYPYQLPCDITLI